MVLYTCLYNYCYNTNVIINHSPNTFIISPDCFWISIASVYLRSLYPIFLWMILQVMCSWFGLSSFLLWFIMCDPVSPIYKFPQCEQLILYTTFFFKHWLGGGRKGGLKTAQKNVKKTYYRDKIHKKNETAISHFDDTVIKHLARSSIDLEVISLHTYSGKSICWYT